MTSYQIESLIAEAVERQLSTVKDEISVALVELEDALENHEAALAGIADILEEKIESEKSYDPELARRESEESEWVTRPKWLADDSN